MMNVEPDVVKIVESLRDVALWVRERFPQQSYVLPIQDSERPEIECYLQLLDDALVELGEYGDDEALGQVLGVASEGVDKWCAQHIATVSCNDILFSDLPFRMNYLADDIVSACQKAAQYLAEGDSADYALAGVYIRGAYEILQVRLLWPYKWIDVNRSSDGRRGWVWDVSIIENGHIIGGEYFCYPHDLEAAQAFVEQPEQCEDEVLLRTLELNRSLHQAQSVAIANGEDHLEAIRKAAESFDYGHDESRQDLQ